MSQLQTFPDTVMPADSIDDFCPEEGSDLDQEPTVSLRTDPLIPEQSMMSAGSTFPSGATLDEQPPGFFASGLLWHARWTVPLHILLPMGLVWLIRNDPGLAAKAFIAVHAGFPLVLLGTIGWWWRQKGDLIALLVINHFFSFAVYFLLP